MECSVCLSDECRVLRLTCTHPICEECLHKWYMKSASLDKDASCPLCRQPVNFPGFSSMRQDWREAAYNSRLDDLFSELIDGVTTQFYEELDEVGEEFRNFIQDTLNREVLPSELEDFVAGTKAYMQKGFMEALKRIERTIRVCREEEWDIEEVEWLLYDTDIFFSDRRLAKVEYIDEPPKPFQSRYTQTGRTGSASPCRCRARQDPWFTVTLAVRIDW